MRDGHGSTRPWSAVITHSTRWCLPSIFLTSGNVYIGLCSTLLLGRSSLCLLACSSLWRKPCRLQGLCVELSLPVSGSSFSWEWMGLQGKEGPLLRPLTLRTTPRTAPSLTAPTCEHTASVSHTEHFPPSLAQPQASPQLQLTVSLARPH